MNEDEVMVKVDEVFASRPFRLYIDRLPVADRSLAYSTFRSVTTITANSTAATHGGAKPVQITKAFDNGSEAGEELATYRFVKSFLGPENILAQGSDSSGFVPREVLRPMVDGIIQRYTRDPNIRLALTSSPTCIANLVKDIIVDNRKTMLIRFQTSDIVRRLENEYRQNSQTTKGPQGLQEG